MKIIVCLKRVPDVAEAEVKVKPDGSGIIEDRLVFDINEPDNYALEEALLIKERLGGEVFLLSLGDEKSDEVLRMGLAKGADDAFRITDPAFAGLDGFATGVVLAKAIGKIGFDIILTGCLATDDGQAVVGPVIAETLSIPHATLVTKLEIGDNRVKANRELEGGLIGVSEVNLPALFTIQTGINEPRYASMIGIKRASKREIKVLAAQDLDIGVIGSKTKILNFYIPPVTKHAEIIKGSPDETATQFAQLIKEKGVL